jgi:xanthine dehydrogenase small subunit
MIEFILNNQDISTEAHSGTTVLDFVRYRQGLKGTKIGCREGDCGACTILVGELRNSEVSYRTMTSCLMPLANAARKHIVTIEGINPDGDGLTPVQQAIIDESGTQCGFCTVGFVMSLTGFCIDDTRKNPEMAVSSIDGNICRCTGYKSIERAAVALSEPPAVAGGLTRGIDKHVVPKYFANIPERLSRIVERSGGSDQPRAHLGPTFVSGGTDVYVQNPEQLAEGQAAHLFYDEELRGIRDLGSFIEIGASTTVTDLLESSLIQAIFPALNKHLKLVSSTPIRNMATIAGNFVNASPIGDMTVWFLALNADLVFDNGREMPLRKLYIDYRKLAKTDQEYITAVRFRKPGPEHSFNFEKVCKRTYLDIATVNTATLLQCDSTPGPGWIPPVLSEPGVKVPPDLSKIEYFITDAHVSAGGVAPIPLYLKETSSYLVGQPVNAETIEKANEIMQLEISPISDVRGSEEYKRLLLRQLFRAHFFEMFGLN